MAPTAPKRGKGSKSSAADKGEKAPKKPLSEKDQKKRELRATQAFFRPGYNGEGFDKIRHAVASRFNEYGETLVFPAGADHQDNDFRVFARFILAGLVPPFSLFLHALMVAYQLRVAQLHPTSLFLLVVFQFLCEGFVGVMPSVALFRRYFYRRVEQSEAMSSVVVFHARDKMKSEFKIGRAHV